MNTKAENVVSATSAGDYAKYALALVVVAAGIAGYYLLPESVVAPLRVLLVVLAVAAAMAVFAVTAQGRRTRDFFGESLFEVRKVVWPTRQETMRITGVVLVVVMVISLILFLFDKIIEQAIKFLLGG
jgi:preprotein translocase subunit SecE